jgi:anti-sigma factor RsiW
MSHAIGAYLDGELPPQARAEMADHLAICWDCNTLAETLRLIKQSLRPRGGQLRRIARDRHPS